jgi:hypothetical protein
MSTQKNRLIPFRVLLLAMFISLLIYTVLVGVKHGWDLLSVFFADIMAMKWPGQFNLDFTFLLMLSGLWLAWRHQFSAIGIIIGILGLFGGSLFLAPYLLYASLKANGEVREIVLGPGRS